MLFCIIDIKYLLEFFFVIVLIFLFVWVLILFLICFLFDFCGIDLFKILNFGDLNFLKLFLLNCILGEKLMFFKIFVVV